METSAAWLAFGLDLRLTATADGGRRRPIAPGTDYQVASYRPDWRLPAMTSPGLVGAPIFALGRTNVAPGERVRAVIVPSAPQSIHLWEQLVGGETIDMHEGGAVCGHARVAWRTATSRPVPQEDIDKFVAWCRGGLQPG